jgi:hypothetical protein
VLAIVGQPAIFLFSREIAEYNYTQLSGSFGQLVIPFLGEFLLEVAPVGETPAMQVIRSAVSNSYTERVRNDGGLP